MGEHIERLIEEANVTITYGQHALGESRHGEQRFYRIFDLRGVMRMEYVVNKDEGLPRSVVKERTSALWRQYRNGVFSGLVYSQAAPDGEMCLIKGGDFFEITAEWFEHARATDWDPDMPDPWDLVPWDGRDRVLEWAEDDRLDALEREEESDDS